MPTTNTSPASRFIADLFEAVDSLDADKLAPFVADDVSFRFGNADPVAGKADFLAASREFATTIAGLRHEICRLGAPHLDLVRS
jgi:ketosteroid isomerase-like protein